MSETPETPSNLPTSKPPIRAEYHGDGTLPKGPLNPGEAIVAYAKEIAGSKAYMIEWNPADEHWNMISFDQSEPMRTALFGSSETIIECWVRVIRDDTPDDPYD